METLAHAVERLTAEGYRDDFRAERGRLRAVGTDCLHEPDSLVAYGPSVDPLDAPTVHRSSDVRQG